MIQRTNRTIHIIEQTIKINPVDVKDNIFIDSSKEVNDKDPKFKIGDHARRSKYKNIFTKGYTPNWSEKVFVTKNIKNTLPWTCVVLMILMMKKLLEHFMKKTCKKLIKKNLGKKK